MFKNMCSTSKITWTLVIVGALNWGIIGLGDLVGKSGLNVVHLITGQSSTLESIIYVAVGIAGVMLLFGGCKCNKCR